MEIVPENVIWSEFRKKYEEKPKGLTIEEIAQLNIASAYLYLYNSALLKDDIAVAPAEDIVWH